VGGKSFKKKKGHMGGGEGSKKNIMEFGRELHSIKKT